MSGSRLSIAVCSGHDPKESDRREDLVRYARKVAVRAARQSPHRLCTVDDVRERLVRRGHAPTALGSAASSLFRTAGWESTCLRVRSRRREAHGRELVVWRHFGKDGTPVCRRRALRYAFGVRDRAEAASLYPFLAALELGVGSFS